MYSLLPGSPVCEYLLAVVDGHQFFGLMSCVMLSCTVRRWLVSFIFILIDMLRYSEGPH